MEFKETNLNFEKKSIFIYSLLSPLLLIIALWVFLKKKVFSNIKYNFYFFDGKSKLCREVKENATKWRALDLTYNNYSENDSSFGDLAYGFWWNNLKNAQALRNRLRLLKLLLLKNIKEISTRGEKVRLISIASGSAQGVIETVYEAKKSGILVKVILIDLDPTAIKYSQKFSEKMGVGEQFTFVNRRASAICEIAKDFKPNLIEMVGFLEYKPFNKAISLIESINNALDSKGVFLTSQISFNLESIFLKEVINWSMIYRTPKELSKIFSLAGFSNENCFFYWEPLKIHFIIEGKKE